MSTPAKIRVAVLTRGDSLESWEVNALKAVKELPFAEIVLEIRDSSSSPFGSAQSDNVPRRSFANKVSKYKWSRLSWNRWFKKYGKVNATQEVSAVHIFKGIPQIRVIPELKGKYSQYFSQADVDTVNSHTPDVILRFGFNILRGDILSAAKHGVWSYHHADHETIRGGPAGFWEYILGHNITGAILQRLTDKLDDGVILRKGYWSLVKQSFRENLDNLLNHSSRWMANTLTEIYHQGKVKPQNAEKKSSAKVYSYPGNLRMLQFWFILFANKIAFHRKNLFCPETWKIGVIDQPVEDVFERGIQRKPEWITAKQNNAYLADPFSVEQNGKRGIVAEEYSYTTGTGSIVDVDTNQVILTTSAHASFPFPVKIKGSDYLLPEISASGRCRIFPVNSNEPAFFPVNEALVDSVLFLHENIWWLFAHKLDEQNNAALFIYYSDDIEQPFTPHALNPVKTDIRNSRSAGAILNVNGKLLRPAQDSSKTYGSAIVINEITDLTPTSFSEREVKRIAPNPDWDYNKGIHTISAHGNKTLIDAKSFRFNFANFRAQLKRKTGRIAGK